MAILFFATTVATPRPIQPCLVFAFTTACPYVTAGVAVVSLRRASIVTLLRSSAPRPSLGRFALHLLHGGSSLVAGALLNPVRLGQFRFKLGGGVTGNPVSGETLSCLSSLLMAEPLRRNTIFHVSASNDRRRHWVSLPVLPAFPWVFLSSRVISLVAGRGVPLPLYQGTALWPLDPHAQLL